MDEQPQENIDFVYQTTGNYYRVTNENTQHILERKVIMGETPSDFTKYIGEASVSLDTPQGVIQEKLVFDLPCDTLERAFDLFDSRANAQAQLLANHIKQQMYAQQNKIVGAEDKKIIQI